MPWSQAAGALCRDIGGIGPSTVWLNGERRAVLDAVFANSAASHAIVQEDMHAESASHPGTVVIPVALAPSEQLGASGATLIEAVMVGYEAMVILTSRNGFTRTFGEAGIGAVSVRGVVTRSGSAEDALPEEIELVSYAEYAGAAILPRTVITRHDGGPHIDPSADAGDGAPEEKRSREEALVVRWPALATCPEAVCWLLVQGDLGLAARTLEAYGRALADYLTVCRREGIAPVTAERAEIARYVRDLTQRPNPGGSNVLALDSGKGLANATLQQRLTAVRLFYDHLMEEGRRESNPVGRGRYTPGHAFGGHRARGLLPHFTKLPWIPTDEQWQHLINLVQEEAIRNRFMLALAYDAALRREELCTLHTDDIDPAQRTVRVRAETTKNRQERIVPYSAATGALLQRYLEHRRTLSAARGPLFLSESRRNRAEPLTLWTWSKVVRALAIRAELPQFGTHTLRHLRLTDLARAGWEVHAIAQFAGHRSPTTTLQYIHLSGRDLAAKLTQGMTRIHTWRMQALDAAPLERNEASLPSDSEEAPPS